MDDIAKLHEADQRLEAAIAEIIETQKRDHEHLLRLDSLIDEFRSTAASIEEFRKTVATREDIRNLRDDLRDQEALHERLDHYRDRLADMEKERDSKIASNTSEKESKFNRRMSWAMVGLFVFDLILGWLGLHHGK